MHVPRERAPLYLISAVLLLALNVAVFHALIVPREEGLTVAFLDVGQGDAILIESPDGNQMLIDGGRDRSVLRQLPKVMGPFDRSLDVMIATHPDADHIGGLPEVLRRYRVGRYLHPGVENDTSQTKRLEDYAAREPGMTATLARSGMRIHLGAETYADVLFPAFDVSRVETNTGSIVLRLVHGTTSFMLTGDAPASVEEYLVKRHGRALDSDVLKAGHHGSRTSTGASWLREVSPDTVVVSAGKDNSYGHPHEEVLARVREAGAGIISTMGQGNVVFVSDGKIITRK